jgi:Arc/MetJ family transcription regulator
VPSLRQRQAEPPAACDQAVIPSYTRCMKTAISVPDEIFNQVGSRAAELGISRSEFFTRAARQYLGQLANASLAQQIDAAIDAAGDDDSGHAAAAAGRAFLSAADEW